MATANAATTYLENRLLNFLFKGNAASFSTPGDGIYVGLATAVSNFGNTTGESADTQTIKNAQDISFDAMTAGTADTITHVFIATDETASLDVVGSGGNVLFIGKLDVDKTIQTGDIFRINQNNLTIELK